MAHVKAGATTKGNRDAVGKRLGVKLFGGQKVISGNIIVRQRGTKFFAGIGTKLAGDYTIFAVKSGKVKFRTKQGNTFIDVIS
jgi:large subunit ribosomal protein L27